MDLLHAPRRGSAPSLFSPGRQVLHLLWTNNPFYLISAWLMFSGLRASFSTSGDTYQTWALLGGFAAYTLLLAAAACVLIRLGRVWEDVRTLLLLVLLMFLAISVSLDEALTTDPTRGSLWLLAGLVFAVAVSEALRVGLRVELPIEYRIPYYLVLALFFLYPVGLAPWVGNPASGPLQWELFAFPTVAGLAFLTLLPGIRRGATLVLCTAHLGTGLGIPCRCSSCWRWRSAFERTTCVYRCTLWGTTGPSSARISWYRFWRP